MPSFDDFFAVRVQEIVSEFDDGTLIFLKGFAIPQIQQLIRHPNSLLNDQSLLQDGYLDVDALNDRWIDFVNAIKSADAPRVGFYEELLVISQFLPRIEAKRIVVVENNMLTPWVPCCFSHDLALKTART